MTESLGTATLTLDADGGPLDKVLSTTELGVLSRFKGMASSAKGLMTAGLMGVGVAAVGVGVALYKVGEQFDEAYDKIRVATGATGAELEGLKEDFKNVVSSVPTDFDSASTAIGELNQRLGLTGPQLRERAKQFLELSRITGTDLSTNIEAVSKAFVDWEVPVKRQGEVLDGFFRLSQETGISVDELASSVQQFGSPLRTLGFTLEESAAMFAMFEKAGVNTQTMVPGLKLAIGNLAAPTDELAEKLDKLGVNAKKPEDALKQVFGLLSGKQLSDVEKMNLAMDVFGKRAGADMAEAVKQGRFEVDDLMDTFTNGKDTIRQAGRDTMDLSEYWQMFKNKALVLIEPIATKVFSALGQGMAAVVRFANDLQRNGTAAFGKFEGAVKLLGGAFKVAWSVVKSTVSGIVQAVKGGLQVVSGIVDTFTAIFKGDWRAAWEGVKAIFRGAVQAVIGIFKTLTAPMRAIAERVGQGILNALKAAWNAIKDATRAAWNWVKQATSDALNAVKNIFQKGWQLAKSVTTNVIGAIVGFVRALPGRILGALGSLAGRLASLARNAWGRFKDGVVSVVGNVLSFVGSIPGKIVNALGNLGGLLVEAGRSVIRGFIEGMLTQIPGVSSAASSIADIVKDNKGPIEYDRVMLIPQGKAMIEGFRKGMEMEMGRLKAEVGTYAPQIRSSFSSGEMSPMGPMFATVKIGDEVIAERVEMTLDERDRGDFMASLAGSATA